MAIPKTAADFYIWCYDFLKENTLPLKDNFTSIAVKLSGYVADEANKEYDRAIKDLGDLKR